VYTKLQAEAEADYLKDISVYQMFSLLESKPRLLSSIVSSLAFHNKVLKPTVLLQPNASTNKHKVQLLTRSTSSQAPIQAFTKFWWGFFPPLETVKSFTLKLASAQHKISILWQAKITSTINFTMFCTKIGSVLLT